MSKILIGVPILNRGDLLMRLFSSISSKEKFDLFIIDNSNGKDEIVTSSIQIVKDRLESVGSKLFHEKYKNIGVAAS